ncbi:metalloregulator ArsR/SmtB family transcription factor [Saccharothrix isguenensis]
METYESDGWAVLGDRTRRTIFERLAERPQSVGELAAGFPVSRSAVSQHLKVLKDAGLVVDRTDGNRRIYQVHPAGVAALRAQLDGFWTTTLAAFHQSVELDKAGDPVSTTSEQARVYKQIVVSASIERAFTVFTERFGDFKPAEHNILAAEIAETVFEPRVGGHIIDRAVDGTECRWARVLAYEPPHRVMFSWDLDTRWQVETDHDKTSVVDVRFIAEGPERTRVELEHRDIERHGDGWQGIHAGVDNEGGWPLYLQRYAELLKSGA